LIERKFKKLGIDALTGQKVASVEKIDGSAKVVLDSGKTIDAEKVLVSVGRVPVCDKEMVNTIDLKTN